MFSDDVNCFEEDEVLKEPHESRVGNFVRIKFEAKITIFNVKIIIKQEMQMVILKSILKSY